MHKGVLAAAIGQRQVGRAGSGVAAGLAQGFKQRPPWRLLRYGIVRRIQGPGGLGKAEAIPGESLVKVGRGIGRHQLAPVLQLGGLLWACSACSAGSSRCHLQTLMQASAFTFQPHLEPGVRAWGQMRLRQAICTDPSRCGFCPSLRHKKSAKHTPSAHPGGIRPVAP